jgi:hypothetical protein
MEGGTAPGHLIEWLEPKIVERTALLTSLEWHLVDLIEALAGDGVPTAAVKGPALGRSLYPVHWWRDFGDLDLLVPAAHFAHAIETLRGQGVELVVSPPSRRAVTLLGKGLTLRHRSGLEIDLHHTLVSGSLGFGLGWDWWMDDGDLIDIGGHAVATTGRVRTALHLLAHLCIGGPSTSLHVARDVAQCLGAIDPDSHHGVALIGAVDEAGLGGLIHSGVTRVEQALGWHHERWSNWSAVHPRPDSWKQVTDRFAREQRSFGAVARAGWHAHHRPAERLAIALAIGWPDQAHLTDRGLSRLDYLKRMARGRAR